MLIKKRFRQGQHGNTLTNMGTSDEIQKFIHVIFDLVPSLSVMCRSNGYQLRLRCNSSHQEVQKASGTNVLTRTQDMVVTAYCIPHELRSK